MFYFLILLCLSVLTIASSKPPFNSAQDLDSVLEKMTVDTITIAAMGRVASLGELYDARKDEFLHIPLVSGNTSSLIYSTHNRHSNLKYLLSSTLNEKMEFLDIQAGFKLGVLFGLFEVSGSSKFIKDKQRTSKSVKVSVANFVTTEYEKMEIAGEEGRKLIDLDVLGKVDATHVVAGIQWGGNVIISVEDTNSAERDVESVKGDLYGKLTWGVASLSLEGSANISDEVKKEYSQFNFELYGDILPKETPTSVPDAIILMKSVPQLLLEGNHGKGKALSYTMLPIALFRVFLSIETDLNSLVKYIDESTINSCIKLFEEMGRDELKINDLMVDLNGLQNYIAREKIEKINNFASSYQLYQNELKIRLSQQLISIRSGDVKIDEIIKVLDEAYVHELSPRNIDFDQFLSIRDEFKFLKYLKSDLSVDILDKDTSFHEYMSMSKNYDKNIYVFFYSTDFPKISEVAMIEFRKILETDQIFDTLGVYIAIKIDVLRDVERETYFNFEEPSRLRMFKNGNCLIENYVAGNEIPQNDRPDLWSFTYMQTLLSQLVDHPVPIGFIYVQLPTQKEPKAIWPKLNWTNISDDYKGLFFRTEGGTANSFGIVQDESTRHITEVEYSSTYNQVGVGFSDKVVVPSSGWSNKVHAGYFKPSSEHITAMRFYSNGAETRPKNTAVRIWKRTA